jgi:hypothetical protein
VAAPTTHKSRRKRLMPKATLAGATHAIAGVLYPVPGDQMPAVLEALATQKPGEIGAPETAQPDDLDLQNAEDEEAEKSAGTSSSTSDDKPDKSGTLTGTDPQSPAPDAESPSELHLTVQAEASSVSSTGGSTQETGSDPSPQSGSSEASPAATPASPEPDRSPADSRKQFAEGTPTKADS